MATQAQIDANRRNAQKSTGPKSDHGKWVVAQNALKHGVFSEEAVIRGEDPQDFAAFADQMRMGMEESDMLRDVLLIERIIRLEWKLRRLPRLEKRAMDQAMDGSDDADTALLGAIADDRSALVKLERYEMRLSRELRACKRQLQEERKMHTTRDVCRAWDEGYNHGVRCEAEAKHRPEPLTPPRVTPSWPLESKEIAIQPEETESAEQSQFSPNDWREEELGVTPRPAEAGAKPSPYPGDAVHRRGRTAPAMQGRVMAPVLEIGSGR